MKSVVFFTLIFGVYFVKSQEQSIEGCFLPNVDDCVKQYQGKPCYNNEHGFRDRCYECSCGPLQTFICWNYCESGRPELPIALKMDLCTPGETFLSNPENTCHYCICGYSGRKSLSTNCKNKPFCMHLGK